MFVFRLLALSALVLSGCYTDYLPKWEREGYGNAGKVTVYRAAEWYPSRPEKTDENTFVFYVMGTDRNRGEGFYQRVVHVCYTAPHGREYEYYLLNCGTEYPAPPPQPQDLTIEPDPEPLIDPTDRKRAEQMLAEIETGANRKPIMPTRGGAAGIFTFGASPGERLKCTVTSYGAPRAN